MEAGCSVKQSILHYCLLEDKCLCKRGGKFNKMGNVFKPNVLLYSNLTGYFCNIDSLLHSFSKVL